MVLTKWGIVTRAVIQRVSAWDHWIAFTLLALIGGRMNHEACSDGEKTDERDPCYHKDC